MNPHQIRERRAQVWTEMQGITAGAEGRSLSAEEISRWDKLDGELTQLGDQLRVAERQAELARSAETRTQPIDPSRVSGDERADTDDEAHGRAFLGFLRHGMTGLSPEERKLIGRPVQLSGEEQREMRAQGVATGAAGGYLVPQGFRDRIVETLKFYGSVRGAGAEVITTETGNTLPWPTNDDTGNKGALLSENNQVTEQDVVIGQGQLGAYTYTSRMVRVSLQLLQDSAFGLEEFLRRKLGERLGRITNEHYTTGDAAAKPQGVVTGAAIGKTGAAGQVTSVTYDDLVDLQHSIDPAYRNERTRWMAHDTTIGAFRKLKDTTGRPLWEPSLQAGQPDSFLGRGIVPNNDMPVMAANAKSILYGDFNAGYVIRDVLAIQVLRLEERFADFLQVAFIAFLRTDALVQDAGALKAYRNPAA